MTDEDDFAPIWEESILLTEHEAVQASVGIGGWLSAALDDPNVCDAMKADINRWFSAGFLYLDEVRKLMQAEREALEDEVGRLRAENERLREALREVFEEWAGSEGFIPETAPEGYLLQLTKRMADTARAALKGGQQ